MSFCTHDFAAFFLVFLAIYWAIPWDRARVYLLLGASFFFYATWCVQLAFLIVVSTTIDYWLARGIDASQNRRRKKLLLSINITGNLGLLCYFKYVNFFRAQLGELLLSLGWSESAMRPLDLLIPVGISFYTFEAISYMLDVYWGRIKAEKNLAYFQMFILFFPHLVAGPIVRGRDFLPQVARRKRFSWPRMQVGVQFFLLGLLKKLAVADRMAQFADPVFKDPSAYGSYAVWLGVLAYALQIYCDFSGYTDMAIGCAHMLGYKLARNFNMPYLAVNISDFWRRWHISLSSWLRDYLFIPLGGSRVGEWITCRNLMITMALGGLWHGAHWTFVAWGMLHGSYLIVHRLFRKHCERSDGLEQIMTSLIGTLLRAALTLMAVLIGWVFFRAQSFEIAQEVLQRMFFFCPGGKFDLHSNGVWFTLLALVLCHAATASGWWDRWYPRLPAPVIGVSYALALSLAQLLAPPTSAPFIYFQF